MNFRRRNAFRSIIVLLCVFFGSLFAGIQVQAQINLSLDLQNVPLEQVFSAIEARTSYRFLYNKEQVDVTRKVSINVQNKDLRVVLSQLFVGTDVKYTLKNKQIVLSRTSEKQSHLVKTLKTVTGKIIDEKGDIVIGASIVEKGTESNGTVTDSNGEFTLEIASDALLQVSYIGYHTQEISTKGKTVLSIVLREDTKALEELVVIGYGAKVKGALTGSVSIVNRDVFEDRPVINSMDALQGKIPGVIITKGSGRPGGENFSLQIRGFSSINGNRPLVLIDGVPGDLGSLNTNDIENISVLKDASAAIYGSRAADGVVLVSTKRGRANSSPSITYTANFGIKKPEYLKKTTNTLHFAEMLNEGLLNVGLEGFSGKVFEKIRANAEPDINGGWNYGVTNYPGFYKTYDWNKIIFKNSLQQIHNVLIDGGGENNKYLFSVGYNGNSGSFNYGKNQSDRYNLRLNYDFRLLNRLVLETSTSYENQLVVEPSRLDLTLSQLPRLFNYVPVYNLKNQFYGYQGYLNPVQYLVEGGERKLRRSMFNTNLKGSLDLLDGLKFVSQISINLTYGNDNANYRTFTRWNWVGGVQDVRYRPNNAYYQNMRNYNRLFTTYLDYNKLFNNNHQCNLMMGTSYEDNEYESQTTNGYNFLSNDLFTLNLADKTSIAYTSNFSGRLNDWILSSYFSRLSYSYKNKISTDLTVRVDGSSKFSPEKRWSAISPSVALAYNLSEEKFVKKIDVFNLLKMRVSWGQMGNQEIGSLGLYDYMSLILIRGNYPLGSPNVGQPGATATIASKNRTWETIENKNIGIDFVAIDNKLSGSFDYYQKINKNMLVDVAVPATFGGRSPSQNLGRLNTKGFDAVLTWADKIKDFEYSVSVQLSDSKNKLVELQNSDDYSEGLNFVSENYPINSYFGYVFDGIIKTEEQLNKYKQIKGTPSKLNIGDVMYKDVDGDGEITAFGDKTRNLNGDMVYLGNLSPRYTYSSTIDLSYKNTFIQLFLQGIGKRSVMYTGDFSVPFYWNWFQPLEYFYDKTWSVDRQGAEYPRIIPGGLGYDEVRDWNWRTSSMRMENVAYLRLKMLTIGYNIPSTLCSKLKIEKAKLYCSGQDLFTFSKGTWEGNFNPEDDRRDEANYPFNKVFSIGVNIKF